MKNLLINIIVCLAFGVNGLFAQTRVVVSTDFPPLGVIPGAAGFGPDHLRSDADDVQSMIRFLLYTNELEGDSPSFLHLVSGVRGMNDPEDPRQPGWGGQFMRAHPCRNHWTDHPDGRKTVWRWRADVQEDFARRAKWMRDAFPD